MIEPNAGLVGDFKIVVSFDINNEIYYMINDKGNIRPTTLQEIKNSGLLEYNEFLRTS